MASASDTAAALQDAAAQAMSQLADVAKDTADLAAARYRQGEAFARDHVAASLGTAVAIGLLAGLFLARR